MNMVLAQQVPTSTFRIAGCDVELRTQSMQLQDILGAADLKRSLCDAAFTLSVDVSDELRPGRTENAIFRGRQHLVVALFDDETFTFDLLRRRVSARVSRHTAENLTFWRQLLLPITLGVMGTTFGLIPLHAACLAKRFGVLLMGNSGAGKSTLALALAMRKWLMLSDDWTYLNVSVDGLLAHGIGAPVKLLPDAIAHFPELEHFTAHRSFNGEIAFEVPPIKLGIEVANKTIPKHIFFIERIERGMNIEPLRPKDVERYVRSGFERLPAELEHGNTQRNEVLRRIVEMSAFRFSYSAAPHEGAAHLDSWIERHL